MNCLFCNDKIIDRSEISSVLPDLSFCQFILYLDVPFVALYTCSNKKISIFEVEYLEYIEYVHPSFKKEYDCIEYNCEDHDEFETVSGRIVEGGFVF